LNYKYLYLIFVVYIFIGCGSGSESDLVEKLRCKNIASELNSTYLDSPLSPIEKGINYLVIKDKFIIEPLTDDEINLELSNIDIDGDMVFDCVKIKQDIDDNVQAQIKLK